MPTLRANVTTPWARAGQTFEVESIEPVHRHHLANKVLSEVTQPSTGDAIGDVPGWDETKRAEPAKKTAAKKTAAKKTAAPKAASDDGKGQGLD